MEKKVTARSSEGSVETQSKKSYDSYKQNEIEPWGGPLAINYFNTEEFILNKPMAKEFWLGNKEN